MVDLRQALAASSKPDAASSSRTALVVGNVGKLGEELLNAVLESPHYNDVAVGVRRTMRTVAQRLKPLVLPADPAGWDPIPGMGRAPDDLFICLEAPRVSYWKVTTPYVAVTSEEMVVFAQRMRAAGTHRIAVLTPMEVHEHLGAGSFIRNVDEMALVQAGFSRIVILRPSMEEGAAASASLGESVANVVLRTLRSVMAPKQLDPVRKLRAARITVDALATLDDGVHVIGAARLRELAGDPMA
jgi:hypothetical protein